MLFKAIQERIQPHSTSSRVLSVQLLLKMCSSCSYALNNQLYLVHTHARNLAQMPSLFKIVLTVNHIAALHVTQEC